MKKYYIVAENEREASHVYKVCNEYGAKFISRKLTADECIIEFRCNALTLLLMCKALKIRLKWSAVFGLRKL